MRGRKDSDCSQILFGGDWMDGWQRVFSQVLGLADLQKIFLRTFRAKVVNLRFAAQDFTARKSKEDHIVGNPFLPFMLL
jgi:hypothetical protein